MTESIAHRLPYPQFEAICDKFANEIVDNMDMDTLLQIAYDQLYDYYTKCNDLELEEEVINHYCGDVSEWQRLLKETNNVTAWTCSVPAGLVSVESAKAVIFVQS